MPWVWTYWPETMLLRDGPQMAPCTKARLNATPRAAKPVNVRSDYVVVAQAAERVPALLIGDDQDDIRRAILCLVHAS